MSFAQTFVTAIVILAALAVGTDILEVRFNSKLARQTLRRYFSNQQSSSTLQDMASVGVNEALKKHSSEFDKEEIITVFQEKEKRVYVAIGWGLANVVLFDDGTDDGLVLIDALETQEALIHLFESESGFKPILRGRKINTLILSHHHQDHVGGAAFVNATRVVAHKSTVTAMTALGPMTGPILFTRSMRQFGSFLRSGAEHINSGIGPHLHRGRTGIVTVTETFSGDGAKLGVKAGAWNLELYHAPGETSDQIVIFDATHRVLCPADNWYRAMPNIYAIRGSQARPAVPWIASLDLMRSLQAEILVPLHTRPITGADTIARLLRDYRDGLSFIHDQTVFWMNRGLIPDEIVQKVELPPSIKNNDYFQPFYGTLRANVRAVFSYYLGWFSGHPVDWDPSRPGALAKQIVAAVGDAKKLVDLAEQNLKKSTDSKENDAVESRESAQLALELVTFAIDALADTKGQDAVAGTLSARARGIRRAAVEALAQLTPAATVRNYFLTWAREHDGDVAAEGKEDDSLDLRIPQEMISLNLKQIGDAKTLLKTMSVNLDAEEALHQGEWLAEFNFTSNNKNNGAEKEHFYLAIRNGIADVIDVDKESVLAAEALKMRKNAVDVSVAVSRSAWVDIMAKERSPVKLIATGELKTSSITELAKFRSMFSSPRD